MGNSGRPVSDRIRARQEQGEWAAFTAEPPSGRPCETCGAVTEQQLVETPAGPSWSCRRCGRGTGHDHVFDPRRPPSGDEEIRAAVECLVQHVMALRPVDRAHLDAVVRVHFEAGWCVRDVLHALNYRPDGETYETGSATWTVGDLPAKTLWRVRERLSTWRWSDDGEGRDVLPGEWTSMKYAMSGSAESQQARRRERDAEWHDRVAAARAATGSGLAQARTAAATAAARGLHRRAKAAWAALVERQSHSDAARRPPD